MTFVYRRLQQLVVVAVVGHPCLTLRRHEQLFSASDIPESVRSAGFTPPVPGRVLGARIVGPCRMRSNDLLHQENATVVQ